MSDVILPGRLGLIVARDPIGRCYCCHVPFYSDRDMRAHMATVEHREAVDAARVVREAQKRRLALFHESDDPEVEEHLRKVGRRMLREGRMVVRPNERAGFS